MAALTQAEVQFIKSARGYYPGSNYALVKEQGGTDFVKIPAVDEFTRLVPFERYDGDPEVVVTTAVPDANATNKMAHLPTSITTDATGVSWFAYSTPPIAPDSELSVEDSASEFGSFSFTTVISRVLATPGGFTTMKGEGLGARMTQMASLMARRELGRQLINGDGSNNTPIGLAKLYDGTHTLETQLLDVASYASDIVAGTRAALRAVSGSGPSGFGQTANALFMSRRAADELLASFSSSGDQMDLQPDVLNPGQRRMHFNGVPIYLAPIRDDEDSGGPGFPTGNGVAPDTTSVYAAIIGGETGVRILYSGGDDENFGLTSESGNSSGIDYYQAFGRYTLFIPERTAVARLHGVTLTV